MHNRTQRICQECGGLFYGVGDYFYCPECSKQKKRDSVIKIRTCKDCKIEFYGGPRAMRCPDCAYIAQKETNRRHKKNGTIRPLGSMDRCSLCGKEYVVLSSRQKYCSDECQRIGVLAWQREHKRGYNQSSGQYAKKMAVRHLQLKVCVYCLRPFPSNTNTSYCSDYCRNEQRKYFQCVSDINRGYKRDLKKYDDARIKYRNEVNGYDR